MTSTIRHGLASPSEPGFQRQVLAPSWGNTRIAVLYKCSSRSIPKERVCHVAILHPPGGVVGGDHAWIDANLDPGAHALHHPRTPANFTTAQVR